MARRVTHAYMSYTRREDDPIPTSISLDCIYAEDCSERVGRARMKWARRQRRRRHRAGRSAS